MTRAQACEDVIAWVRDEITNYSDTKWERGDAAHANLSAHYEWWEAFVLQYIGRARVLRETPAGKQALLKALVTLYEMCVTMWVELDGDVPAPGYPSGELHVREMAG